MRKQLQVSPHVRRALEAPARQRAPVGLEAVERLAIEALAQGAERKGSRKVFWDVSGDCRSPVHVVTWSRATGLIKRARQRNYMMEVSLDTRCRKCPECRKARARLWRARAIAETKAAERTWFGTLTANLVEHHRFETQARAAAAGTWEGLSNDAQFHALATEFGKEITLWLKRVRKNGGLSFAQRLLKRQELRSLGEPEVIEPIAFRYLITCEVHDSEKTSPELRGRPHFHCLIHEYSGRPIRKNGLQEPWKLGFTNFKLVKGMQGPMYVAKYLEDADDVRVRASENYGVSHQDDALASIAY